MCVYILIHGLHFRRDTVVDVAFQIIYNRVLTLTTHTFIHISNKVQTYSNGDCKQNYYTNKGVNSSLLAYKNKNSNFGYFLQLYNKHHNQ